MKKDFYNATPRFRFLNMVAQFAEILRDSKHSETGIAEIYNLLKKDEKNIVVSKEDGEFLELVKKAMDLGSNKQRD